MTATTSTLQIAHWVERRLDLTLGFHLRASRLFGIVVNDPLALAADSADGGASAGRICFIGEGGDAYALLAGPCGAEARGFDAAALVSTGWAAPMLPDGTMTHRASHHPLRRRVRSACVIDDDGIATVLRFEDDPTCPIGNEQGLIGDLVPAMDAMWWGELPNLVNLRATRGGCTRRP